MEQLSLLGLAAPTPLEVAAAGVKKIKPKMPLALDGVGVSAVPVDKPHGLWRHPQANREALLKGQAVGYWFRRGQRHTIGFSVGPQGLSVSAPRWTPLAAVDAALQTKADWVLRKLAQVAQRHAVLQATQVDWVDGTELGWMGGTLTVRLGPPPEGADVASAAAPRHRGQPLVHFASSPGTAGPDTLWVALPATATAAQLRDAVQAWMMQAAHAHFVRRLDHFAPLLGVRWALLKLSAATTRWGSAKADGSIRLHWRLMQFAPDVVDYVVAHELAHLRHMDHSDRFWQTVAGVVPDYAALRARLKGERLPPW